MGVVALASVMGPEQGSKDGVSSSVAPYANSNAYDWKVRHVTHQSERGWVGEVDRE